MSDVRAHGDPELVAQRLGLTPEVVRRLRARGAIGRFDLSDAEIRRRLCEGHVRGVGGAGPFRR